MMKGLARLFAVALLLIFSSGAIHAHRRPALAMADDLARRQTMDTISVLFLALESYAIDHGAYPVCDHVDELRLVLEPRYLAHVPRDDGWGHALHVRCVAARCKVVSFGRNGIPDEAPSRFIEPADRDLTGNSDDPFASIDPDEDDDHDPQGDDEVE